MRKFISIFFFISFLYTLNAEIVCGTWNLKWFPSGKANLKAEKEEENTRIKEIGKALDESLSEFLQSQNDKIILFFQEVRDKESSEKLIKEISRYKLSIASISEFSDNAGIKLWQQVLIASNCKVLEASYQHWESEKYIEFPRGFAYAILDGQEEGLIACFSLHLKSNLNRSRTELEHQTNIYKREQSAKQILSVIKELQKKYSDRLSKIIIAGDFNTSDEQKEFLSEDTLRSFYGAHFRSCHTGYTSKERITRPGHGIYPDSTFDYILYKGFDKVEKRKIFNCYMQSDHFPVFIKFSK